VITATAPDHEEWRATVAVGPNGREGGHGAAGEEAGREGPVSASATSCRDHAGGIVSVTFGLTLFFAKRATLRSPG
jgi:hypothetical protein